MECDFEYINKLLILQENKGCHLANKLKKQHLFLKGKLVYKMLYKREKDWLKYILVN